jgi:hypothetical protein
MSIHMTAEILDTLRKQALDTLNASNGVAAWAWGYVQDVYIEARTDGVNVVYFFTDFTTSSYTATTYSDARRALKQAFSN